jgi:hypothetical protein
MVGQLADHDRAFDAGILGDLADRSWRARRIKLMPASWSSWSPLTFKDFAVHSRATPPPGTMPSSTAARVAFRSAWSRVLNLATPQGRLPGRLQKPDCEEQDRASP